ncbi:hypothetical protein ACFQ9X_16000 [Catenulispora yoronensis]
MTALTGTGAESGIPTAAATRRPHTGKVTQTRVLTSEWIKFRSLRSSYWSLLVGCGAMIALGLLFSLVITKKWDTMPQVRRREFDAITVRCAATSSPSSRSASSASWWSPVSTPPA